MDKPGKKARLRKLFEYYRITQTDVANYIGKDVAQISRYVNSKTQMDHLLRVKIKQRWPEIETWYWN